MVETQKELYAKAKTLEREGKLEEAREAYAEAIKLDPNFTKGWYNLMLLLKKMGLDDEARKCAETVLEQDPSYGKFVAKVFPDSSIEEPKEEKPKGPTISKFTIIGPGSEGRDEERDGRFVTDLWSVEGLIKEGDIDGAIALLKNLTEDFGTDPVAMLAWLSLGQTYLLVQKWLQAEIAFKAAIAIIPVISDPWEGLAICQKKLDKTKEAKDSEKQAKKLLKSGATLRGLLIPEKFSRVILYGAALRELKR